MPNEKEISNLIPGYALNCLDEEDAKLVASALKDDEQLQAELLSYMEIADKLALTGNHSKPSADLKYRLTDRVQLASLKETALPEVPRESFSVDPTSAATSSKTSWWQTIWNRVTPFSPTLVGASLVLILILIGSQWFLQQQISDLENKLASQKKTIVNLVNTKTAPRASGYIFFVGKERKNILFVRGLDFLDQKKQYQLWMVQDGMRTSEAVFSVHPDGTSSIPISFSRPLSENLRFGISIEPQGGSPGPTGSKVLGTTR